MPTYTDMRMAPPKTWDEFERIALSAANNRWENADFTKNSRQGQRQNGVDIYGKDNKGDLVGIQCKNTFSGINNKAIESEIVKAESFKPSLKRLYIATTADTDMSLQEFVRVLSDKRTSQGKFAVAILFWNDVWQDLCRNESRLFQHYPQLRPKGHKPSHDQLLYKNFHEVFPYAPCVNLFDKHDFKHPFHMQEIAHLHNFCETWDQPEKEFLDEEIQTALNNLFKAATALQDLLAEKLAMLEDQKHYSVFSDFQRDQGPRSPHVIEEAKILNKEASKFASMYKDFIKLCKKKLEY